MISVRPLYILKEEYIVQYQTQIRELKKQGFSIIGYARKSVRSEDHETRIKLLRLMYRRLKERSMVDRVFVSYSSQASDPLSQRDMNQEYELLTTAISGRKYPM
ncbi:hypothetical protein BDF14DRAFT_1877989 [Spinellus fusiger]|nr:hypothetical protein BDF14DRAFT_1877989 [Spinellus fusiger]